MIFESFIAGEISKKELKVYLYLNAKKGQTTSYSELARFVDISVVTAKVALEGLQRKGYIQHDKPNVGQANFVYRVKC